MSRFAITNADVRAYEQHVQEQLFWASREGKLVKKGLERIVAWKYGAAIDQQVRDAKCRMDSRMRTRYGALAEKVAAAEARFGHGESVLAKRAPAGRADLDWDAMITRWRARGLVQ